MFQSTPDYGAGGIHGDCDELHYTGLEDASLISWALLESYLMAILM
jgi:hypothetical protein